MEASTSKWTVIIPTWNRTDYLEECLSSVMNQSGFPDKIQIHVQDNASDLADIEGIVQKVGGGRISFSRNETNIGFVRNANRALEAATGELTHLLSDDDFILPGFYEEIENLATKYPEANAYACSCLKVDAKGSVIGQQIVPDGLWKGVESLPALLQGNPLQMPGVAVKSEFYHKYGLFLPELIFTADWEMWIRAAMNGGLATTSQVLAAYRVHTQNDTTRISTSSAAMRNTEFFRSYLLSTYPQVDIDPFDMFFFEFSKNQFWKLSKGANIMEYFRAWLIAWRVLGIPQLARLLCWESSRVFNRAHSLISR